jgi:hypothetical protein
VTWSSSASFSLSAALAAASCVLIVFMIAVTSSRRSVRVLLTLQSLMTNQQRRAWLSAASLAIAHDHSSNTATPMLSVQLLNDTGCSL